MESLEETEKLFTVLPVRLVKMALMGMMEKMVCQDLVEDQ